MGLVSSHLMSSAQSNVGSSSEVMMINLLPPLEGAQHPFSWQTGLPYAFPQGKKGMSLDYDAGFILAPIKYNRSIHGLLHIYLSRTTFLVDS